MKKVLLILGVLLSLGLFCACSSGDEADSTSLERGDFSSRSEEKTDSTELESYISGTIRLFDHEELGKYVFVDELKMPEGDDKYSYLETVVVPKNEFPLQNYETGDVISFNIVEVLSEFPPFRDAMHSYSPSTQYLCSITLYK